MDLKIETTFKEYEKAQDIFLDWYFFSRGTKKVWEKAIGERYMKEAIKRRKILAKKLAKLTEDWRFKK